MRVLIVYENGGMGHKRMARILQEIIADSSGLEIISVAGSEMLGSPSATGIVELWNFLIRKNLIRTVDYLINFFVRMFVVPVLEVIYTAPFWNKLDNIRPDLIISTCDAFNRGLGAYARANKIPFHIFLIDISIFSDMVNPNATHICYFQETADALRSFDFTATYFAHPLNNTSSAYSRLGYVVGVWSDYLLHPFTRGIFRNPSADLPRRNDARALVIGPLAEKQHFQLKDSAVLRQQLGLDNATPTILAASGSIGGRFLLDVVDVLCRSYRKPVNVLVMCGNDQDSYRKFKAFRSPNANINIFPREYVHNFGDYLAVADCVVVRPSEGVFIETLLARTPTIALGAVPSNDKGSLTIIQKYEVGEICLSSEDLPETLDRLLMQRDRYVRNIERLLEQTSSTFEEKAGVLRTALRANWPS